MEPLHIALAVLVCTVLCCAIAFVIGFSVGNDKRQVMRYTAAGFVTSMTIGLVIITLFV